MNYYTKRGAVEYGPYSLAELQQYVKSGNVWLGDLCRSDGTTEWVMVSQVLGNIPATRPVPGALPTGFGGVGLSAGTPSGAITVPPPSMEWGIVLLLSLFTCSIFGIVWLFIQANFVKKIDPESKAQMLLAIYIATFIGGQFVGALLGRGPSAAIGGFLTMIILIGGFVSYIMAIFQMKASLEAHYPGLQLSGVMVFFFNVFYFQYHLNNISKGTTGLRTA